MYEYDIKIVYGHTPIEFGIAASRYSRKNRLPFIYEVHGLIYDNLWRPKGKINYGYSRFMQQFYMSSEKSILKKADILISQTNSMKARISEIYGISPKKIMVIYNGVEDKFFDPNQVIQKSKLYRKERGWNQKVVIMYSGFLDSVNGVDFLVESAKNLPEYMKKKIKVVFLGRGHYEKFLKESSLKYPFIDYLGLVSYEEMPVLYGCCDVFVIPRPSTLPSETLMPVKLLEAMAMEKVVLVSDVGGMTEVVRDQENGFVFKKGDRKDFIAKLTYIIEEIQNVRKIGIQARKDVIENLRWNKSRELLQNIYQSLI